jgi:hypothetical protein
MPKAVGKYHKDAPGPVLNKIESQVPKLATKKGKTHVHQGRADFVLEEFIVGESDSCEPGNSFYASDPI